MLRQDGSGYSVPLSSTAITSSYRIGTPDRRPCVDVWMPPKMQGVFLNRESCDRQRSCVRPCCAALTMPLAGMAMRGSAPEQNGELEALWTPLAGRPRSPGGGLRAVSKFQSAAHEAQLGLAVNPVVTILTSSPAPSNGQPTTERCERSRLLGGALCASHATWKRLGSCVGAWQRSVESWPQTFPRPI
jgi:hypothetical protein